MEPDRFRHEAQLVPSLEQEVTRHVQRIVAQARCRPVSADPCPVGVGKGAEFMFEQGTLRSVEAGDDPTFCAALADKVPLVATIRIAEEERVLDMTARFDVHELSNDPEQQRAAMGAFARIQFGAPPEAVTRLWREIREERHRVAIEKHGLRRTLIIAAAGQVGVELTAALWADERDALRIDGFNLDHRADSLQKGSINTAPVHAA